MLTAAQDHALDLADKLGLRSAGDFTAAELRASWLGRDLRLLCEAARGEVFDLPDRPATALDRVLRALFPEPFDGSPPSPRRSGRIRCWGRNWPGRDCRRIPLTV